LEKNNKPKITLDHIIKERYPTFVDALRDLDDALSMLFLFANLPSTEEVPRKTIELCQRLCYEFEHYLIVSHSLRKSFLSIKGIYYQATIQGQDILWLVPYKFVQRMSGDIDFRIMGTFVEFYTTLLGFVNFRLYTSIGLVYPPTFDATSDEKGGELGAFTLKSKSVDRPEQKQIDASTNGVNGLTESTADGTSSTAQALADTLGADSTDPDQQTTDKLAVEPTEAEENQPTDAIDIFTSVATDGDTLDQPFASSSGTGNLFTPFTFFLSRETPRQPLEFIIKAFGCKRVGWDKVLGDGAFMTDESDRSITHQIVDRPNLPLPSPPATDPEDEGQGGGEGNARRLRPGERVPGRTYVQPQWVWDCINAGKLLRPDLYAPGATLPPHLSPWVKPKKGEYDPTKSVEEQERVGEAEEALEDDEELEKEEVEEDDQDAEDAEDDHMDDDVDVDVDGGMDVELAGEGLEDDDAADVTAGAADNKDEWGGFDSEEELDDEEKERRAHQAELEAEALGKAPTQAKKVSQGEQARKKAAKNRKEEEEELQRQRMMLSRRKRKLHEKMEYSNKQRDAQAEGLRAKKRKIEKAAAKK